MDINRFLQICDSFLTHSSPITAPEGTYQKRISRKSIFALLLADSYLRNLKKPVLVDQPHLIDIRLSAASILNYGSDADIILPLWVVRDKILNFYYGIVADKW